MARSDTLDFEIFGGILQILVSHQIRQKNGMTHSCELKDFSSQVFEDGSNVDSSLGSNSHFVLGVVLQKTLDTSARELMEETVSIVTIHKNAPNPEYLAAGRFEVCRWSFSVYRPDFCLLIPSRVASDPFVTS